MGQRSEIEGWETGVKKLYMTCLRHRVSKCLLPDQNPKLLSWSAGAPVTGEASLDPLRFP